MPKKKTGWGVISSYWGAKEEELASIKVCDIFDCFSYGNKELLDGGNNAWASQSNPAFIDSKSEQTLLTLVCQSEGTQVGARTLCMQLPSKEDRNFMVSGFRMMRENNPLAFQQVRNAIQSKVPTGTKMEVREANSPAHISRRRVTKRDAAIEETRARKLSDASSSPTPSSYSRNHNPIDVANGTVDTASSALRRQQATAAILMSSPIPDSSNFKGQLQDERFNSDRLRTQALLLQNELHERDEEIVSLKKERAVLESTMKAKQIMYEQDAHVRMQVGQKLEQTILDREELRELNDALSGEIFQLKKRIAEFCGIDTISNLPPPVSRTVEGTGFL